MAEDPKAIAVGKKLPPFKDEVPGSSVVTWKVSFFFGGKKLWTMENPTCQNSFPHLEHQQSTLFSIHLWSGFFGPHQTEKKARNPTDFEIIVKIWGSKFHLIWWANWDDGWKVKLNFRISNTGIMPPKKAPETPVADWNFGPSWYPVATAAFHTNPSTSQVCPLMIS